MNNTVFLRVNGQEWGGWTSVRIAAGIERIARDFSVEITRNWPGDTEQAERSGRIKNGDLVEVLIGTDKVLTGYVEATPVRYDARSISTGISGRSKTADLIDCSATPSQYAGRSLAQVAAELAKPFSIAVVDAGGASGALQGVQADQGETVMDVLNKMLGLQQALAYDNELGDLVIGGIGSQRAHTALVLVKTFFPAIQKRASATASVTIRYQVSVKVMMMTLAKPRRRRSAQRLSMAD